MTTPFVFVSNVRRDLDHFYQERLFNARVGTLGTPPCVGVPGGQIQIGGEAPASAGPVSSPLAPHGFQRTLLSAIFSTFVEEGLPPIRLLASPTATVPRLGLSDDQQLFVTQLDAPASTVRTLNEGETI